MLKMSILLYCIIFLNEQVTLLWFYYMHVFDFLQCPFYKRNHTKNKSLQYIQRLLKQKIKKQNICNYVWSDAFHGKWLRIAHF